MERLLKIVDGPLKGAEAALVPGTRIRVGSGEDCDIVIADASLPSVAFELDVSDDAVSLVTPDGETAGLADFEVREFGSTGVAIGPAEGAWGELRRPEPKAAPAAPETQEADERAAAGAADDGSSDGEERKGGRSLGCLIAFLLAVIAFIVLLFWGCRHREGVRSLLERGRGAVGLGRSAEAGAASRPDLGDIAQTYGLRVEEREGRRFLVGNLRRRTERLAIRAMALASDRTVRFDLTDDQSVKNAVADTLFIASEGRLKVLSVTNRVAEIAGTVSGPHELARVLAMLNQDVPMLVACTTDGVRAGDAGVAAFPEGPAAGAPSGAEAARNDPRKPVSAASLPRIPVAGILTAPYPCVVLADGSRCLEGARIGGMVLARISAEELVFRTEGGEMKWRP